MHEDVYCAHFVYDLFKQHMFTLVISSGNGTRGCGFSVYLHIMWQDSDKEDEQGQSLLCFKYSPRRVSWPNWSFSHGFVQNSICDIIR